jgi:hypothetical protein
MSVYDEHDAQFEKIIFSSISKEQAKDLSFMNELYAALCNMTWARNEDVEKEGRLPFFSCTWRTSGAICAEIRTELLDLHENYLDFYCAGNEGKVSERVREHFANHGWQPVSWDEIEIRNGPR